MDSKKNESVLLYDAWANVITGLGDITKDKTLGHQPTEIYFLSDEILEAIYHNDGLANTIVGRMPEDAFRQGFEITGTPKNKSIKKKMHSLGAMTSLQKAATWGRLYGWGALLIISDDPGFPTSPIDPSKITKMRLVVCDRRDLQPVDEPLRKKASFFRISSAQYSKTDVDSSEYIHESRLIQFSGEPTSNRVAQSNWGSDLSVLHRSYDALREYNSNAASAALMMSDGSLKVMKIDGFHNVLASNDLSNFKARMELMDLSMFVGKTVPIDKEEDLNFVERAYNGIADIITESKVRLAASAGMPMTVLFGVSPAGLNATGESDTRHWYDQVQSEQKNTYTDPVEYLIYIIASFMGIKTKEDLSITWNTLWQRTAMEEVEYRRALSEVDRLYFEMGALTAQEIRDARFGEEEFSARNPDISKPLANPEPTPVTLEPEVPNEEVQMSSVQPKS